MGIRLPAASKTEWMIKLRGSLGRFAVAPHPAFHPPPFSWGGHPQKPQIPFPLHTRSQRNTLASSKVRRDPGSIRDDLHTPLSEEGSEMNRPDFDSLDAQTTTVSPEETAERFGNTVETLANWRWKGQGPRFVKVGGRVRYRLSDLAEWLDLQTRNSTSEGGPDA